MGYWGRGLGVLASRGTYRPSLTVNSGDIGGPSAGLAFIVMARIPPETSAPMTCLANIDFSLAR